MCGGNTKEYMDTFLEGFIDIVLIICWVAIVRYCRKVARRIGYNKDVALLVGFFCPLPALILYAYYSNKKRNKKI